LLHCYLTVYFFKYLSHPLCGDLIVCSLN
jgi:hypothetical protein